MEGAVLPSLFSGNGDEVIGRKVQGAENLSSEVGVGSELSGMMSFPERAATRDEMRVSSLLKFLNRGFKSVFGKPSFYDENIRFGSVSRGEDGIDALHANKGDHNSKKGDENDPFPGREPDRSLFE